MAEFARGRVCQGPSLLGAEMSSIHCHEGLCMSQHTGSHKNSLNLLGEKYLNESHWPMRRIRLLDCTLIRQ